MWPGFYWTFDSLTVVLWNISLAKNYCGSRISKNQVNVTYYQNVCCAAVTKYACKWLSSLHRCIVTMTVVDCSKSFLRS